MNGLPTIEFRKDVVRFDQIDCTICKVDYELNEIIVELACKHLFHSECLIPQIILCPLCKKSIESRDRQFSRNDIDNLVESLFQKVFRYFPFPTKVAQKYFKIDFSKMKTFVADSLEQSQKSPNRSIFTYDSPVLNLEIINKFLDNFSSKEAYENNLPNLLQEYKNYTTERIQFGFNTLPQTINNYISFDEFSKTFMDVLKFFLFKADILLLFCIKLKTEIAQDPRIIQLFEGRKNQFIHLNREFYQGKNFLYKTITIKEYSKEQVKILSESVPGFKNAYRLNCVIRFAMVIFFVGILHKLNVCDLKNFRSKPIRNTLVAYFSAMSLYRISREFFYPRQDVRVQLQN